MEIAYINQNFRFGILASTDHTSPSFLRLVCFSGASAAHVEALLA
jgi:hypothetical protein